MLPFLSRKKRKSSTRSCGAGCLAAHETFRLMLLGSPPDMVRRASLRETGSAAACGGLPLYSTIFFPKWQQKIFSGIENYCLHMVKGLCYNNSRQENFTSSMENETPGSGYSPGFPTFTVLCAACQAICRRNMRSRPRRQTRRSSSLRPWNSPPSHLRDGERTATPL